MSFDIYLQCLGDTDESALPRSVVRALFPLDLQHSQHNDWCVRFDPRNVCHVRVTPAANDDAKLKSLVVERPCGDLRLCESLLSVAQMGSVVLFWPGGPPVVAHQSALVALPKDMLDALPPPRVVRTAAELRRAIQES